MKRMTLRVLIPLLLATAAAVLPAQDRGDLRLPPKLGYEELARLIEERADDFFLVDVRTPREFRSGAIPTAINIPVDMIGERPPTADRSAPIVLYCRSGSRSAAAQRELERLGFDNVVNFGGISAWKGEVVRPD